jgi:L-ascorbate metabolism protein UlaG (beta-lactamase superfamily)
VKLTFLGHSCVLLETKDVNIVIDPFIEGNPSCPVKLKDVNAEFVVVTHAHGDHWGDAIALGRRGATIIGTWEIGTSAQQEGVNGVAMNMGGTARFPWGSVKLVPAWHSSSFPDGRYGGMPCGAVLEVEGKRVYHSGDTALFSDLKLIGDLSLDHAFLCIGDYFTMGPAEALEALKWLRPKSVTPIHFDTFPPIRQDGRQFCRDAERVGVTGVFLEPGSSFEL